MTPARESVHLDAAARGRLHAMARRTVHALMVVAALAALGLPDRALAQTLLPPFHVQTLDGTVVAGAQLGTPDAPWAIVFVTDQCAACDGLIESLSVESAAALLPRIAIVVGDRAASEIWRSGDRVIERSAEICRSEHLSIRGSIRPI